MEADDKTDIVADGDDSVCHEPSGARVPMTNMLGCSCGMSGGTGTLLHEVRGGRNDFEKLDKTLVSQGFAALPLQGLGHLLRV